MMYTPAEFVQCPLYTRYLKKIKEFRVYVFRGQIIDVLEKRRDSDRLHVGTVDEFIRTEKNGWVFCRQNVHMPVDVGTEAQKAVAALGLTFGGVDVCWNEYPRKAFVLEVNTAPSIFGDGVKKFAKAIQHYAEVA